MAQVVEPKPLGQVNLIAGVTHRALNGPWAPGVAPFVVKEGRAVAAACGLSKDLRHLPRDRDGGARPLALEFLVRPLDGRMNDPGL